MKLNDAAQILGLSGEVTPEEVKRAYRQAALKFHPDRNPAGPEMMKIINATYDVLKNYAGQIETEDAAGEAGKLPRSGCRRSSGDTRPYFGAGNCIRFGDSLVHTRCAT